jgi:hypothetical protein
VFGQGTPSDKEIVAATKTASIARQMKGLKRKRKFTRNLKAPPSMNQKNSNFNYVAFQQDNAVLPSTQVDALIAPGKARSLLSKVKRDQIALRVSLEFSARKQCILVAKSIRDEEKIFNLKRINNQLMVDIL